MRNDRRVKSEEQANFINLNEDVDDVMMEGEDENGNETAFD